EIIPGGGQFSWAGAMFTPGSAPMEPVNLSSKKEISFWAKGNGERYMLVVLTAARSGQNGMPAMVPFVASKEWNNTRSRSQPSRQAGETSPHYCSQACSQPESSNSKSTRWRSNSRFVIFALILCVLCGKTTVHSD